QYSVSRERESLDELCDKCREGDRVVLDVSPDWRRASAATQRESVYERLPTTRRRSRRNAVLYPAGRRRAYQEPAHLLGRCDHSFRTIRGYRQPRDCIAHQAGVCAGQACRAQREEVRIVDTEGEFQACGGPRVQEGNSEG